MVCRLMLRCKSGLTNHTSLLRVVSYIIYSVLAVIMYHVCFYLYAHPVSGKTCTTLLNSCSDPHNILFRFSFGSSGRFNGVIYGITTMCHH